MGLHAVRHARITALDTAGGWFVDDVGVGDLWYFPPGVPHSIQGLGPDGCEFLLAFDNGNFDEDSTFLLSDWFKHIPPEVLAKTLACRLRCLTRCLAGRGASLPGRHGGAGFGGERRVKSEQVSRIKCWRRSR